jgi:Flp pilus assembly protein TadD
MITGGEQKPGAARETRALGPNSGRRPEIRKKTPFPVVRKSGYGYLVASLTVLMLWGTLALGVVGCSTLLSRFSWLHERPGASTLHVRPSSKEISRLLRNAHYYKLMGRPDLAFKELQQAHQQDPDNLKIINSLAQYYEQQGKFEAARQLYREGLTRHGPNPVLTNNLCFTYYLEGRYQKAETCFRQALAQDPQNVAARNNLGLLYCRQGRQDKARRLWQAAEGDATADYKVHQALVALGMYDGAVYAQKPEPSLRAAQARVAPKRSAAVARPATPVPAEVHTPPQPVAHKLAPKSTTPVAARISPSRKPETIVLHPLASQPGRVHASQPVTTQKASLQAAHKPVHPVTATSNTPREKAQVYAKPQPVAPKATTRPVAHKLAPKSTTPVAARISPSRKPEAAIHHPLASQPVRVHLSRPVTPQKASLQAAQKPAHPVTVSSKTPREKAQVYAKPQPVAPKATTRPVAHKLAPKSTTPVAVRISPTPRPGVGIARLATRISAKVHALARLAILEKSSQQMAQKPAAKMPVSSVIPQGKVLDQAALEETRLAMVPIVAANAPPLMYPSYLTCAELVNTSIEVRNGTWTRNLAHETRSMLTMEGFNVTKIGNNIDFGAKKTIIFYRPGAGRVARALGHTFFPIAELKPSTNLKKGTDVKILLGADLLVKPTRLMACLGSERR